MLFLKKSRKLLVFSLALFMFASSLAGVFVPLSGTGPWSLPGVEASGTQILSDLDHGIITSLAADFFAVPTSGQAPLSVDFTDESSIEFTDWAWYFGDEAYDGAWVEMNSDATLFSLFGHSAVALPDGSIVIMGGYEGTAGSDTNNVWRSTDKGTSWDLLTDDPGWSIRRGHTSVVLSDGSIILMGGYNHSAGSYLNDVWLSSDKGETWEEMTASAEWSVRNNHTSVVLPDDSIVLMGGGGYLNDVWRSTDQGATWSEMTKSADWHGRDYHSSVALPDGSILLMGGFYHDGDSYYKNDVWRSDDQGASWTELTAEADWPGRHSHNSVVMPDGSVILLAGYGYNDDIWLTYDDVWRSTDGGVSWVKLVDHAEWDSRQEAECVVLTDVSIILIGGSGYDDVWRLQTAGSTEQNPTHLYTEAGRYNVTLQAYNSQGYKRVTKEAYINVLEPEPSFSDVPADHPFFEEIEKLVALGITTGYDDGTFRPTNPVTRQAVAAFLYRAFELEDPGVTVPTFSDVPITNQFFTAIEALVASGVAEGWPDGTFRPTLPVTRQAAAAFLYRILELEDPGLTVPTFTDVPTDHPFFKEIEALAATGITTGWPDGTFRPTVSVTRQAIAAFLIRALELE